MIFDYDYLARVSRDIVLYTNKKTSNLLEGSFSSVVRGKSLDFDDLREYSPGDDIHDIDWKSSSRADKILIRRYIAEKKHNVLFVADTGPKMDADTEKGESKAELSLLIFGALAYILGRQGADFALMKSGEAGIDMSPFRSDTIHLERLMRQYGADLDRPAAVPLAGLLDNVTDHISRHMILMILTDIDGIASLDEALLTELSSRHDVYVFCVGDAYFTGPHVFDAAELSYVDRFLSRSGKLKAMEEEVRSGIMETFTSMARRFRISFEYINSGSEIIDRIAGLFERRRHEFFG